MASALDKLAELLVLQGWQIAVVFALVLLTTLALRRASSHWRYLLWLVVVAKCLTPPLVSVPLAVLPHDVKLVAAAPEIQSERDAETDRTLDTYPTTTIKRTSKVSAVASASDENPSIAVASTLPATSAATSDAFNALQWLVLAWLAVVVLLSIRVLGKVWATQRRLRRTRRLSGERIRRDVAELANGLGMKTSPTVYMADTAAQPFVWGWLKGDVYLPVSFEACESTGSNDQLGKRFNDQQQAILCHELAHVARWDAAVNVVQVIVQTIFFFHPLVWWANKRIRQEREKCCDEIVLCGSHTQPQLYCEAIVNMLAREFEGRHSSPALAVTGSTGNIEDRITTILSRSRTFHRRPSVAALTTFLFVAALTLPTAFELTTRTEAAAPQGAAAQEATEKKVAEQKAGAIAVKAKPDVQTYAAWPKGQTLDVQVIDAKTQQPIPDVTLELQNLGPGIDFQDVKISKTDADGRSLLKLTDLPAKEVRVYPTVPGYIPLRVFWEGEPHATMPKSITIPLDRGHMFGGIIQDEEGEPIPDVEVSFNYWADGAGENPHIRHNVNVNTKSDKDGRWQVDNMPATVDGDKPRIYVSHPDYVSDHLERGIGPIPVTERPLPKKLFDQTAVMVMRKGKTIFGVVVDRNGRVISGAKVHADEHYNPKKPRATTDKNGEFRLSGIKPETLKRANELDRWNHLRLTVQAKGYAPELVTVSTVPTPLEIRLQPGRSIHGKVVDADGNPLKDVRVNPGTWRGQRNRLRLGTTKTAADGTFRLTDVPTDDVLFNFYKDGMMAMEKFPMSPSTEPYTVTMKAPIRIVGSVSDAETGERIENFTMIQGTDFDDGRAPHWMSYRRKQITNGRYESVINQETFFFRVRIEAEGYMPAESRIFRPYDPDKGEITYDFKLTKAQQLSGLVVGLDGEPLKNADVCLAIERMNIRDRSNVYYGNNRKTKTDANGRFEFAPEVEPYFLVVVHEEGVAAVTEEEHDAAQPIPLKPWTNDNHTLQIIRRPAAGQSHQRP